ncbi:hypothetical protein TRVL_08726 [Trypanosoma vivax]|nr:hypothetical protein TRVL_08726 [Trypanosoma vivax]
MQGALLHAMPNPPPEQQQQPRRICPHPTARLGGCALALSTHKLPLPGAASRKHELRARSSPRASRNGAARLRRDGEGPGSAEATPNPSRKLPTFARFATEKPNQTNAPMRARHSAEAAAKWTECD